MLSFLIELMGWMGTILVLVAYVMVSARDKKPGPAFYMMNAFGGAFLVVNGAFHGAWPSVGLNVVWVVVGAVSLCRARLKSREREETDAESLPR